MALHLILFGLFSVTALYFTVLAQSLSDPSSCENGTQNVNYVFPNTSISCGVIVQHPCLTLNDYSNNVDTYFVNDSTFVFIPGNHQLSVGLSISSVHNLSIAGLSENSVTIEILNESVFFACKSCMNVSIANIIFSVDGTFSCILSFERTYFVKLSNITILGNRNIGCSSIISERSIVDISYSTFTDIRGYYGAALIASSSIITFAGNNSFVHNMALSGGSLCLYNSTVFLNGTIFFTKNFVIRTTFVGRYSGITDKCVKYSALKKWISIHNNIPASGGAIFLYLSSITSVDHFMFTTGDTSDMLSRSDFNFSSSRCYPANDGNHELFNNQMTQNCENHSIFGENITKCLYYNRIETEVDHNNTIPSLRFYFNQAFGSGGSIFSSKSSIKLVGTIEFVRNFAEENGGALLLKDSSHLSICDSCLQLLLGNIRLVNNHAQSSGGALYALNSYVHFRGANIIFMNNFVENQGGAILITNSIMQMCGILSLANNNARIGGAVHSEASNISIGPNVNCGNTHTTIDFRQNTATYSGGSISSIDSHLYILHG